MIIELVTFRLQSTVTDESFLESVAQTNAFLKQQPGFIARKLCKSSTEEWFDMVHWDTMENALQAMEVFQSAPEAPNFSACLDLQTMKMYHLDVIRD